jgi:hypothetical protein
MQYITIPPNLSEDCEPMGINTAMTPEQRYHADSLARWVSAIVSELAQRLDLSPIPSELCIERGFYISMSCYSFPYFSTIDGIEEDANRVVEDLLNQDKLNRGKVQRWCLVFTLDGRLQYKRQFGVKT